MSKNKTKFEVSISKSVTVQIWGDLPSSLIDTIVILIGQSVILSYVFVCVESLVKVLPNECQSNIKDIST